MFRRIPLPVLLLAITGFGLLYIPMMLLIIYSFNASRLAAVWGGFSTRWYVELLGNEPLLLALFKSLWIAVASATLSTVFGILIAFAFVRFGSFRGRLFLSTMASAPMVMPEVVTGLSLLLLFIAMESAFGWPAGRGLDTITVAHATFGMCFAAVVIQARLRSFDLAIEEAARDLGARQPLVFLTITLPVIAPAVIAAWLLAFTLSFDDLVIASFVSGPGSTTLPILVFSKVRLGITPEINAIATILFVTIAVAVCAGSYFFLGNNAQKKPKA